MTGPADAGIECRGGGPTRIVLEFTEAVTLEDCDNVSLSSGSCSGVSNPVGNRYEVALSGAAANACLTLTLVDVASTATGKGLVGVKAVNVVVLQGDVDATGAVNTFDLLAVQGQLNESVTASNFRCDVTDEHRYTRIGNESDLHRYLSVFICGSISLVAPWS